MNGLSLTVFVTCGGEEIYSLGITRVPFSIGASPHNDVVLDDPYVSREHARVLLSRGRLLFTDQSTNGSFFRGQRIHTQLLDSGDTVEIPPFELRFEYSLGEEAERRTAMRRLAEIMPPPEPADQAGRQRQAPDAGTGRPVEEPEPDAAEQAAASAAPAPGLPPEEAAADEVETDAPDAEVFDVPDVDAPDTEEEGPSDDAEVSAAPRAITPVAEVSEELTPEPAEAMPELAPGVAGPPPTIPIPRPRRPTEPALDRPAPVDPVDGTVHFDLQAEEPSSVPGGAPDTTVLHDAGTLQEEEPEFLVVVDGPRELCGKSFALPPGEVTIGRGERADLRFEIGNISRAHVRLLPKGEGYWLLKDLASLNGTYVEGRRVTECTLRPGDEFRLANSIAFRLSRDPEAEGR